jgi:hypothetical protein
VRRERSAAVAAGVHDDAGVVVVFHKLRVGGCELQHKRVHLVVQRSGGGEDDSFSFPLHQHAFNAAVGDEPEEGDEHPTRSQFVMSRTRADWL